MFIYKNKNKGFSLVELIVAIGIFSILASGVTYVVTNSYNNFYGVGDKQKIAEFAQEGLEAVRKIKDDSWTYFVANVGSNKGVSKNATGSWQFSGSSDISGDLTRVIYIANVSRDSQSNIVESGGTDDPLTKKVTVTVSGAGISDYVISTYLTNWGDKNWTQTDWSGGVGAKYWSSTNKAYTSSSMDGISTIGALELQYTPSSYTWSWSDITDFASTTLTGGVYDTAIDDANGYLYVCGSSTNIQRYAISGIRTPVFSAPTSLAVHAGRAAALNPVYPHLYIGGDKGVIKSISTTTYEVIKTYTPATNLGFLYSIVVNAAGNHMYAAGAGGAVFSLDINTSNGALTCRNCTLWCDSVKYPGCIPSYDMPQKFANNDTISAMWLDEANSKLYFASDDPTRSMMWLDYLAAYPNLTAGSYYYSYAPNVRELKYLGTNPSGQNRFLVGADYNASGDEFFILDDTGATFSKAAGLDLSASAGKAIYVKDIAYTGNSQAFVVAADSDSAPYVWLWVIDGVTTLASPSLSIAPGGQNNTTYGNSTLYYHPMDYSNTYGGVFAGWTYNGSATARSTFIEQQLVPGVGTYAPSGDLVSSFFDLGSADKDLHTLTVNQNIPSGCVINITFSADDNSNFSSPTTQVFTSTSANYTTAFNADMSGQRWLKYQVAMTNCNSNTETPTLYDLKINYR